MRKIKEVLRLKFSVGLGLRAIARSCSIGLGTVHEYLQRADAAGVKWPLGEEWDEDRLEVALFGGPPRPRPAVLPMPDFADLHQQRQRHSHLTQQLLWEEYRQANPDGYRYSRFCEPVPTLAPQAPGCGCSDRNTRPARSCSSIGRGTTIPIYDPSVVVPFGRRIAVRRGARSQQFLHLR